MIHFEVEDTVTKYLDELDEYFDSHKELLTYGFTRSVVGNYGGMGTGHIAKYMSTTFNPYLYSSGQDEHYWKFEADEGMASIEVLYSGMGLHNEYPVGKAKVWWEFAKDPSAPQKKRVLERDYAYYQETGIDPIANSRDAKHKHAISRGLAEVGQKDLKQVDEYLMRIMNLQVLSNPAMMGRKR